jgi:hypothetical protein
MSWLRLSTQCFGLFSLRLNCWDNEDSARASHRRRAREKRHCLIAVKHWPGCETVAEIGIVREELGSALTVLNYGALKSGWQIAPFVPSKTSSKALSYSGRRNGKLKFACAPSSTWRLVELGLKPSWPIPRAAATSLGWSRRLENIGESPGGAVARLTIELLLNIAARRHDAHIKGQQHIRDGKLSWRPNKALRSTGKLLSIRIMPEL